MAVETGWRRVVEFSGSVPASLRRVEQVLAVAGAGVLRFEAQAHERAVLTSLGPVTGAARRGSLAEVESPLRQTVELLVAAGRDIGDQVEGAALVVCGAQAASIEELRAVLAQLSPGAEAAAVFRLEADELVPCPRSEPADPLRAASPATAGQVPEGPDALAQREAWFRERTR